MMITRLAEGIFTSKWKDKLDQLFLSTNRLNFIITKNHVKRGKLEEFVKPTAMADYNSAKTYI